VSGIHRHKWSGVAACAWGAGDTKPGQPALLPRLRCSPLLRVSGSGMHMGGTLSTLFWFFFFLLFFYFCGDPKMGYNRWYRGGCGDWTTAWSGSMCIYSR